MAGKIGDGFVSEMLDRGRRELGGLFYEGSNIAQPMYPLRPGFSVAKEAAEQTAEQDKSSLEDRLKQIDGPDRDEPERNEPEIER